MKWAQVSLIVLFSISLLVNARDHGKPKEGNDNFWGAAIGILLLATLIYFAGGFAQIVK